MHSHSVTKNCPKQPRPDAKSSRSTKWLPAAGSGLSKRSQLYYRQDLRKRRCLVRSWVAALGAAFRPATLMCEEGVDGGEILKSEQLWEREKDSDGTHTSWYNKAVSYWDQQEASYNGVLGGFGHTSAVDIRDSRALLLKAFKAHFAEQNAKDLVAVDTGAGVGRVTEQLLLHHFGTVDVLEPSGHLLDKARTALANPASFGAPAEHAAGEFYQLGLQDWTPQAKRYDCIWVQWCLLYLTDDDVVAFLKRAAAGLRHGGLIVVKENVCGDGFIVDRDDSSLTRSSAYLSGLFSRAGMAVAYNVRQRGMPPELFEVRMFVLKPREAQAQS